MTSLLARIGHLMGRDDATKGRMLGGFVDSLVQMFENCRPGLTDQILDEGHEGVERFFVELYEKERPRLAETIRKQERHLSTENRGELVERVDDRIRKVVIPAYVRLAGRFTRRERNDFHLLPEPFHGLERLGWAMAGMGIGAFVVWAPFIPLTAKEWVLPFVVGGLVFPNVRRFLSLRRYQAELNALVARTDDEIWRMDLAYLTDDMSGKVAGTSMEADAGSEGEDDAALRPRLDAARPLAAQKDSATKRRLKEGGR